jgi:hypothetical protein
MSVILSSSFVNGKPEPDWSKLIEFKMYAISYAKPIAYITNKALDTTVSIDIPIEEAKRMFMGRVKPSKEPLLYQTMIFCVLKFKKGPERRFIISSHGGFFTDLYAERLYEVMPQYRDDWEKFISSYERKLLDKNYLKHYPNEDTTQWYRGDPPN